MSYPQPSPLTPEELAVLGLNQFIALDLETTGLDARKGKIIEFGAVRFEGGQIVDEYSELVGIGEELSDVIVRLTGITDDDLKGCPPIEDLFASFAQFVGRLPVVGQNISFDLGFIQHEMARLPSELQRLWNPGPVYDTLPIAASFFPCERSYSLASLVSELDVELLSHHRAVHDARATGQVLLALVERARRIPHKELTEMQRLLGGASFAISSLLEGLLQIGPGDAGYLTEKVLPDNRIGGWIGADQEESAEVEIDRKAIDTFFSADGPLSTVLHGFHPRESQLKMAKDVAECLIDGGALLAEAETGTGKSFAYLFPAVLYAKNGGGRVVVSTYTRHLQDQLFTKDLPALNQAMGKGLRAVLLKGRNNYICKRRFDLLASAPEALTPEERLAMLPLSRWLARTITGDISETNGFRRLMPAGFWQQVTAESGYCTAKVCRAEEICFLHRIRSSAQTAHVVLVNHALVFSDLATGMGVLGDYEQIIFDEAHHVEKVASDHLGIRYNQFLLERVLQRLIDRKNERGLLNRLKTIDDRYRTSIEKGDLNKSTPVDRAIENTQLAGESGSLFLEKLSRLIRDLHPDEEGHYDQKIRYRDGSKLVEPIKPLRNTHHTALKELVSSLKTMTKEMDENDYPLQDGDDIAGALKRSQLEVNGLVDTLEILTGKPDDDRVFWYEIPQNDRFPVTLCSTPLNIGDMLDELLYSKLGAAVFTSATLAVDEKFTYTAKRLGLDNYQAHMYASPFELKDQLSISIADLFGNPKGKNLERYTRGVAKLAVRLATELDRGTLVLFTSGKMLRQAYDYAKPELLRRGRTLLGQGIDGNQMMLLERFKKERNSVLFGLDSFWEGIDVKGSSLELLIIARLPFVVPTDPIVEAKAERIEKEGGNPFMEYFIPEAVLKLRQGIGRLIRSTDDQGVAVICDPRTMYTYWGKVVSRSMSVQPQEYKEYDTLKADLERFLSLK